VEDHAPADHHRRLALPIRCRGAALHHDHVLEDRARAAGDRRPRLRRQGRRVSPLHGSAAAGRSAARDRAFRGGAAGGDGARGMAAGRRRRALLDHGAVSRLHRRLARRMEHRQGGVRRQRERLVQLPERLLLGHGQAGGRRGHGLLADLSRGRGDLRVPHDRESRGGDRRDRCRLPGRLRSGAGDRRALLPGGDCAREIAPRRGTARREEP
jgi:hypothetical protein